MSLTLNAKLRAPPMSACASTVKGPLGLLPASFIDITSARRPKSALTWLIASVWLRRSLTKVTSASRKTMRSRLPSMSAAPPNALFSPGACWATGALLCDASAMRQAPSAPKATFTARPSNSTCRTLMLPVISETVSTPKPPRGTVRIGLPSPLRTDRSLKLTASDQPSLRMPSEPIVTSSPGNKFAARFCCTAGMKRSRFKTPV